MQLSIYDSRVLAIDLRSRRSGFAIYEGARRLLDFGTIAIPSGQVDQIANRLSEMLKLSLPMVIVVKKERWDGMLKRPSANPMIESLKGEAEALSIPIRLLGQAALNATFRNLGCGTKIEVSTALATIFPELVWQIPPERKMWESEHPRQSVFDAIGLGLAYWEHKASIAPSPQNAVGIKNKDI